MPLDSRKIIFYTHGATENFQAHRDAVAGFRRELAVLQADAAPVTPGSP